MVSWVLEKKWRIVLAGLFTVTIPIICLALFVNFAITDELKRIVLNTTARYADDASDHLSGRLNSAISFGKAYATRPYLIKGLINRDKREMDMHLKEFVGNAYEIERAFISSAEGVVLASYPEDSTVIGKDFRQRDWYKGVLKSAAPYVSDFYMRAAYPRRYVFSIAIPITGAGGGIHGFFVMQPNEGYIKNALAGRNGNEKDSIYIVDKKGNLVYHSGYKLDKAVDFSHIPSVERVMKGLNGVENMVDPDTKEPVFVSHSPVENLGWGVLVQIPEKEVFKAVRKISLALLVFTGVMLVLGGFSAYKASDIMYSIKRLTEETRLEEFSERANNDMLTLLNRQWSELPDMCNAALLKLSEYISLEAGVIYVCENEALLPSAGFGAPKPPVADSLALECCRQKSMLRITNIPSDTNLSSGTVAGVLMPKEIMAFPLLYREELMGVMEVACIHGFSEMDLNLLAKSAPQLAAGISTVSSHIALTKLSEELSSSNEELQVMNEELRAMNEELQAQQDELSELNVKLAEASKAKSNFLANMSHELRTPLNAIIGFSEVLLDELFGKLNKKQNEYSTEILGSGRHLLSLINDILDLSKVEAGNMELEPGEFSINELLNSSITMIREKAVKHEIKLILDISPGADMEICADLRKMKQIMFNLLSNAAKFTPDGGSITVHAQRVNGSLPDVGGAGTTAGFVEIAVEDTGVGIKPEDIPKLFKEFVQLESPYEKRYEGTGLGLVLAKKLVELHGGEIWVESEFGRGSVFRFRIPHGKVTKATEVSAEATEDKPESYEPAQQRKLALIIEDDIKALEITEDALLNAGYTALKAFDGKGGIEAVKREAPDLIVLDLMMPGMSGFEVIDLLHTDVATRGIPIVVLTAMSLSQKDKERLEHRAQVIIEKGGITKKEFIRALEKASGRNS